jgi:hypothetical protein
MGNDMSYTLSAAEHERFSREGWIGPYPLMSQREAHEFAPELQRAFDQTLGFHYPDRVELERFQAAGGSYYQDRPWFQSLHALSPRLLDVGRHPAIVERIAQLLSDDLMLWATICFAQDPNGRLHWHSDNEFHHVRGVSAWVAIANVSAQNSLKLLPGSHRLPKRPEDYLSVGAESMASLQDNERALSIARQWQPEAQFLRPPMRDGEFILFSGTVWHASDNPASSRRYAMGLRYSSPDQQVRIPLTAWEPTFWDPALPPTVMVRGEDRYGVNRRL